MRRSGFKRPNAAEAIARSNAKRAEAAAVNLSPAESRKASAQRSLRRIQRIAAAAAKIEGSTTEWESEFLTDVAGRLQRYGRAFADPEKGNPGLALSFRQSRKVREIHRSVRRKEPATE